MRTTKGDNIMKKFLIAFLMTLCLISSLSAFAYSFAAKTDDTLKEGSSESVGLGNTWKED